MTKYVFLAAATLMLAACSNEEPVNDPLADGPVALGVTAEISAVATRASSEDFYAGDPIGIFPVKGVSVEEAQANKKYVSDNYGRFSSDDPYYFYDREEVTFFAYYPYDESLTAEKHRIAIDTRAGNQIQSTISGTDIGWRMNDYLSASAATTVSSPTVYYTGNRDFEHVMSRVIFEFKAGTDDSITDLEALTGYTLAGLVMEGTFDTGTGVAAATADAEPADLAIALSDVATTDGKYTAAPLILFPQTAGTISLSVVVDGETHYATLTIPDGALQAGNNYTWDVTFSKTGLTVGSATIDDWTEVAGGGITAKM